MANLIHDLRPYPAWATLVAHPLCAHRCDVVDLLPGGPQVRRYLGSPVAQDNRRQRFEAYLAPPTDLGLWAARHAPQAARLGMITLAPLHDRTDPEVSYMFLQSVWGMGVATRAVTAFLNHARDDLALPRVVTETQAANHASRRLLERVGIVKSARHTRFGAAQVICTTAWTKP